jgi:hypothetical protein
MSEKFYSGDVLKKKSLGGNDILLKIRYNQIKEANNVRLHLAELGLKTSLIFGSSVASQLTPEQCDTYFEIIKTRDDFYRLSELSRESVVESRIR